MIDWGKIRKEFEETDITAKALAEKHHVNPSTLHYHKRREKWKRKTKTKKATDRRGGQPGNKNAQGNSGGGSPPNNKNALKHGLFANFIPRETLEIMQEIQSMTPADMIWQNILIQYSAIIRSQRIMLVRNELDDTSNVTGIRLEPNAVDSKGQPLKIEEKREWHMAYEKQEKFLNAQSRAISTLSGLIKQFITLADDNDKRKLELESMRISIDRMKAEMADDTEIEDDGFLEALNAEEDDLWQEE